MASTWEEEDNKLRDAAYLDARAKCMSIPERERESLVNQKAATDEIKRILYERHADTRSLRSLGAIRDLIGWLMFDRTGTKTYTVELTNDENPTSVTIHASDEGDKNGPLICRVEASHKTKGTSLELAVVLRPTKLLSTSEPGRIISDLTRRSGGFEAAMRSINKHSAVFIMDINPGEKDKSPDTLSTPFNFTVVSVLKLLFRVGMIHAESMVVCTTDTYKKDPRAPSRGRIYSKYDYSATIEDLFASRHGRPIKLVNGLVHAVEAESFDVTKRFDGDENVSYKRRTAREKEVEDREQRAKMYRKIDKAEERRARWNYEEGNRKRDTSVKSSAKKKDENSKKKKDEGSCAVM